jgi:hypothetical protein
MRHILTLALLATISTPCSAEPISVTGVGNKACSDFIAVTQGTPTGRIFTGSNPKGYELWGVKAAYLEWARGFISGVNWIRNDHHERQWEKDTTITLEVGLLDFCNKHPTEAFYFAVLDFVKADLIHDER